MTVTQEDGSQVTFTNASGTYTPTAPRYDATLTKSGSAYIFTRTSKNVFTFDTATGRLHLRDRPGPGARPARRTPPNWPMTSSGHVHSSPTRAGRVYTLTLDRKPHHRPEGRRRTASDLRLQHGRRPHRRLRRRPPAPRRSRTTTTPSTPTPRHT
ncbi:hypothetical protein ACRAWF_46285 [Streptomyces sp. L7]